NNAALAQNALDALKRIERTVGAEKFDSQPWLDRNIINPLKRSWGVVKRAGHAGTASTYSRLLGGLNEMDQAIAAGPEAVEAVRAKYDSLGDGTLHTYLSSSPEQRASLRALVERRSNRSAEALAEIAKDLESIPTDPRIDQAGDAGDVFSAVVENPSIAWRVGLEGVVTSIPALLDR